MQNSFLLMMIIGFCAGCPGREPHENPNTSLYPSCDIIPEGDNVAPPLLVSAGQAAPNPNNFLNGSINDWYMTGPASINLRDAWNISRGSKDVVIAVIDSQFVPHNPAFSTGQCLGNTQLFRMAKNIDNGSGPGKYHGAGVASLISTCENNALSLDPVNGASQLLWLDRGDTTRSTVVDLLAWAVGKNACTNSRTLNCNRCNNRPADILNASLGYLHPDNEEARNARRHYLPVIELINMRASIVVAAAGNEHVSSDDNFPSNLPGVISVGATTKHGKAASFSNWGETVEIMAPGEQVPLAYNQTKALGNGTSFSAPLVTGVISLMRSVYPALNWKTAVYFLQSTSAQMNCDSYCSINYSSSARAQCWQDCCGGSQHGVQTCTPGRVNAGKAVALAKKAQEQGLAVAAPIALIDSNIYLVPLHVSNGDRDFARTGNFILRNQGGASGYYYINSIDGKVHLSHEAINIAPGEQVTITVTTTNNFSGDADEARIRIASPTSGVVGTFSDELVIYAQSV